MAAWTHVRVFLGGSTRTGVELQPSVVDRWAGEVAAAVSSDGATVLEARGVWRGASEPARVVEAYVPTWGRADRARLDAVLTRFLVATCQDAVLVVATPQPAGATVDLVSAPDHDGVVVGPG